MQLVFENADLDQLQHCARQCANASSSLVARSYASKNNRTSSCDTGLLVSLEGPLGAGKTSFARAFIQAICNDPDLVVPSPSFALLQPFELDNTHALKGILHIDFYRLDQVDEAFELGLDSYGVGWVILAEWLENGAGALGTPDVQIALEQHENPDRRNIHITGLSEVGQRFVACLAQMHGK